MDCHASEGFGEWAPTIDELVAALQGVDEHCAHPAAVKACVVKMKTTAVILNFDRLKGPSGCSVTVKPASFAGHHFVIVDALYRNNGGQFAGITFVQKQRGAEFFPYAEIMSGDAEECRGGTSAPSTPISREMRSEFPRLPPDLRAFICTGGR